MVKDGDDHPAAREVRRIVDPYSTSSAAFSMPPPATMPPSRSQNYRLSASQKSSPTSSTEITGETGVDIESPGSSPTSQPGAYMVNMRAAGARPGWASNRRIWNTRRSTFFDSFRSSRPSSIPPELRVVQDSQIVQIEMQGIPNMPGPGPLEGAPGNCEIVSQGPDKEQQQQYLKRLTWVKIAVMGFTFGTIIALIVAFVDTENNKSAKNQLVVATNTSSSDYLGTDESSMRSSSEVQAAIEVYLPLVKKISNQSAFDDFTTPQARALTWLALSAPIDPTTKTSSLSDQRILTRYSLAVLFFSSFGEMWLDSLGFLDSGTHECNWNVPLEESFEVAGLELDRKGVICNGSDEETERRVEILNLDTNNLGGTLPHSEMNALDHLKAAIFANNSIAGTIPSIWNSSSLLYLDFSQNKLTSTIPETLWRGPTKLTHLNLMNNELSGSLSVAIAKAENLKVLRLDNNDLDGSLPDELGQLLELHELGLEHNRFSRTVPQDLGKLKSLYKLNLNHNSFTGEFPWGDFGVREDCVLTDLNLGSNSFVGLIPWDILSDPVHVGWGCLERLTLKSSGFSTEVLPESAFNNWVDSLKHLDIGDTLLRGAIPETISDLSNLEFLDLGINALTGTIPLSITELSSLHTLNLYYNMLNGTIPSDLGTMEKLTKIDMMGNQFGGTIPESLSDLSSLAILHLRQNLLTGTIPTILAELMNLQVLSLSINKLQGSLEVFCQSGQAFKDLTSDCKTEVECSCCTKCY